MRYMDGWPYERELEQGPPIAELMRKYEKSTPQFTNSLEDHLKPADEFPELLPVAQPLKSQPYKKSNSQYRTYLLVLVSLLLMIPVCFSLQFPD